MKAKHRLDEARARCQKGETQGDGGSATVTGDHQQGGKLALVEGLGRTRDFQCFREDPRKVTGKVRYARWMSLMRDEKGKQEVGGGGNSSLLQTQR